MSKIMLVNVTHVEETRVAILEDGVLSAYEIETINRAHMKGNIHNAVVESVHSSLEAAFVKIAPDLKGFLPLDQVNFRLLPRREDGRSGGKIGQHLQPGQKIMAQIVREPFAGKPPTISTYFSLPGRFLVLMPGVDSSGISRKIEDSKQRDRLKKIIDELKPPEGFGLIIRTAGITQTKTELQRDLRYLLRLWESIQKSSGATEFPGLVYREADLVIRTIRDHLSPDVSEVWIDSEETYEKALKFVRSVMPNRAKVLKLYRGDRPQFNKYNLEEQIERIYKRRVPLPAGGEIVIDGTEALTAIDVNSARSKRSSDLEELVLQTNLEAAAETARQLRLRDLGGLVVIDFIDMATARNRGKVEKHMRDSMKGDRAKSDLTRISKLGLMEIARQRIKGAKMAASYATCPVCDGHGLIKNVETSALAALRKLQTRSTRGDVGRIRVSLPPEVATWLLNNKRGDLANLERRHRISVDIEPNDSLLRHDVRFDVSPREKEETVDTVVAVPAEPATAATEEREQAAPRTRPVEPRRRSRRRRGGAGRQAETPSDEQASEPVETPVDTEAGDKVVPFAPRPATSGATDGEEGAPTSKPRRRRKRRRGGRNSQPAADPVDEGGKVPDSKVRDSDDLVIPVNVRSDELMPAAAPSKSGARRRGAPAGRGRGRGKKSPKKTG